MTAGRYNFTIEQGAQFSRVFTWSTGTSTPYTPVNVTGYTSKMKIKDSAGDTLVSLTNTPNTNGDVMTLGGSAGTITVYISATTTEALTAFSEASWDMELVNGSGVPVRLLQGKVAYSAGVTN